MMLQSVTNSRKLRVLEEGREIPIAQSKYEISTLMNFLRDKSISTAMEIGISDGGTTLLLADLVGNVGMVYALDICFSRKKYSGLKLSNRITEIEGDSHSQDIKDNVYRTIGSGSLGFLFIDGDHSHEGVKDDFNSYSPLVSKGGWIALHDIRDTPHHRRLGCFVCDFWNEIKDRYQSFEILDPEDESRKGIGVIKYEC